MGIADDVGTAIYQAAGCNPLNAPDGGAPELAARMCGPDIIYAQPRAMAEGTLATIKGARRIVVRKGLPTERMNFVVAEQLAQLYLEGLAWFRAAPCTQTRLDVAAWLVAPPSMVQRTMHQVGINIGAIADTFTITWTCATLRVAEVGGPEAVVATPDKVHRKGGLLRWVADDDIRAIASKPKPKGLRKIVLRDEPGRVALLAKAS